MCSLLKRKLLGCLIDESKTLEQYLNTFQILYNIAYFPEIFSLTQYLRITATMETVIFSIFYEQQTNGQHKGLKSLINIVLIIYNIIYGFYKNEKT